jgi:hypothetical protein
LSRPIAWLSIQRQLSSFRQREQHPHGLRG